MNIDRSKPYHRASTPRHEEDTFKRLQELSSSSADLLQKSQSHVKLSETVHSVRMLSKSIAKTSVTLDAHTIMIVTKARDNSLVYLTRELTEWLLTEYRDITVYVDHHLEHSKKFDADTFTKDISKSKHRLKYWTKAFIRESYSEIDLIITLGGDGTVLYVSSLFQRSVPPVISFSLGSLGFLTNFQFEDFKETLKFVMENGVRTNLRTRLSCRVHRADGSLVCEQQALNELTIDRGPSPFVSMLELYGDNQLLTVAQADGLILATPTGSTAYSLSAGGSLVHPGVNVISVTPICPHTLSFRPILLPDSMILKVKVPKRSRSTAWASFDGRSRVELMKGDYVTVSASPFSFPTVLSSSTDYFDSVSRTLNWNIREEQKSFVHLLSTKNQKHYAMNKQLKLKKTKFNFNDSDENLSDHVQSTTDVDDEGHDSPLDIDDNEYSTFFVPEAGQGVVTPTVNGGQSLSSTPKFVPIKPHKKQLMDLSHLSLHK